MRSIDAAVRRLTGTLTVVVVTLAVFGAHSEAADPNQPPETTGAFNAAAFTPLPASARIEISLMDDSPENLELGWRIQQELQKRGYAGGDGTRLVLTIDTDVSIVTGEPSSAGQPAAEEGQGLDVIGFLRATLDDPASQERFWAAEAAYRRSDGDLPAGAKSLAPLLVEQIGRSIELPSIRIR